MARSKSVSGDNSSISASDSVEQVDSIDDAKLDLSGSSEKVGSTAVDEVKEVSQEDLENDDERPLYVKGEPVIRNGLDVSRYAVDIRDDHDPSLTFRSFFLGTCFGALGATLGEIYQFKPIVVGVSSTFLLLLIYSIGMAWSKFLPRRSWVERYSRLRWLGPFVEFINPGEFGLKEHVVATLMASTASGGSAAVTNFAVQRLFYNTDVGALTAVLASFSVGLFGYGLVGLLRPLIVYPSEMVYWGNLPTIMTFQALHFDGSENRKKVKFFWTSFTAMFTWEIFPSYIFPLLNGFNVVCLATQKAPANIQNVITNVFGGGDANEGLGLLSVGLDWQYITSGYISLPLVQQANFWVGCLFCYIVVLSIYYTNTWNSLAYPMLSTALFDQTGAIYNQEAVFGTTFTLNETALEEYGLPALTGSNAWTYCSENLAIGGMLAHCALFWGPSVIDAFKWNKEKANKDPHYRAMKSYKEVPWYWYIFILVLSFIAGLIVVTRGQTTLPWWAYIVALVIGAFIAPFSIVINGRLGSGIGTNQLMQMIAGVIVPGKPVANLYFSTFSHNIISQALTLASDLKMGQYLKIPPRTMFITQVWGVLIGSYISYAVMISVVDSQRTILLDPIGTNVWSGQYEQSINSAAVTWALAKELYSASGPYLVVPIAIFIGMVPTIIQWLIYKRWPKIGFFHVDSLVLPIIYQYSAFLTVGVNSPIGTMIAVGIISQVWLRRYHPGWFRKYNYLLGGAFDGGAQIMIFILSFAVFGASGTSRPFPTWAGNPAMGNIDYCNGNGALGP